VFGVAHGMHIYTKPMSKHVFPCREPLGRWRERVACDDGQHAALHSENGSAPTRLLRDDSATQVPPAELPATFSEMVDAPEWTRLRVTPSPRADEVARAFTLKREQAFPFFRVLRSFLLGVSTEQLVVDGPPGTGKSRCMKVLVFF
jgi:hypothetical protein